MDSRLRGNDRFNAISLRGCRFGLQFCAARLWFASFGKVSCGSLFLFLLHGKWNNLELESSVQSLLQPITDELDLEILKVSIGSGGHSQLLRVVVDRAGGVDSDHLERVSRGLALQLDAEDLIKGAYRLEVSSPGLDWPLESEADFSRYRDEWVKVFFIDGTTCEGRNLGAAMQDDTLVFTLLCEAEKKGYQREERISMADVTKVVRAINWKEVSRKK